MMALLYTIRWRFSKDRNPYLSLRAHKAFRTKELRRLWREGGCCYAGD